MNCLLCDFPGTAPVPFELPPGVPGFVRCRNCGSDTSPLKYGDVRHLYSDKFALMHRASGGGAAGMRVHCWTNCEWFQAKHDSSTAPRTLLDVGSCDGACLDNMTEYGWDCEGFEVFAPDGPHRVTVREEFRADLFPRRFGAVLSREVIEHVPDPREHLRQLALACEVGGLVQVQTPRTMGRWDPIPYQTAHLCVISPPQLRRMVGDAGLTVVDSMLWEQGQALMCRK